MVESQAVQQPVEQHRFAVHYDPEAGRHTAMLTVTGEVSFREALALRQSLLQAIEGHPERNLVVELSQVVRLDTAAMAVLLEVLMATRGKDPEIFLVGASEDVTKVFRLAGFEEALLQCVGCMDEVKSRMRSPAVRPTTEADRVRGL